MITEDHPPSPPPKAASGEHSVPHHGLHPATPRLRKSVLSKQGGRVQRTGFVIGSAHSGEGSEECKPQVSLGGASHEAGRVEEAAGLPGSINLTSSESLTKQSNSCAFLSPSTLHHPSPRIQPGGRSGVQEIPTHLPVGFLPHETNECNKQGSYCWHQARPLRVLSV